jgi:hypothetical protein
MTRAQWHALRRRYALARRADATPDDYADRRDPMRASEAERVLRGQPPAICAALGAFGYGPARTLRQRRIESLVFAARSRLTKRTAVERALARMREIDAEVAATRSAA